MEFIVGLLIGAGGALGFCIWRLKGALSWRDAGRSIIKGGGPGPFRPN